MYPVHKNYGVLTVTAVGTTKLYEISALDEKCMMMQLLKFVIHYSILCGTPHPLKILHITRMKYLVHRFRSNITGLRI
jgi:hypothetical protein